MQPLEIKTGKTAEACSIVYLEGTYKRNMSVHVQMQVIFLSRRF